MNGIFQPDPVVLFFLFAKKFLYLEVLAILALLRLLLGRGLAQGLALVAFMMSLAGIATIFAPAFGLNNGVLYTAAARTMAEGGGLPVLIVPSIILGLSGTLPGVRARWIDLIHLAMLAGLVGLWWWTS
ncbi:hypothetical protein [Mameliella alba]|uniref:hypothetical protein n=1 Tax=Mameliella alba TaxID=561184 RepID=UPI001FD80CBF|nr:hypothetical protein [Mameliella alba]